MSARVRRLMTRFGREEGGVAAVEFAFIAPLMIVAYFGVVDVTMGVAFKQRLNHSAAAVNDLVGQAVKVKQADLQSIFNAAEVILQERDTSDRLKMRTTSVKIDANGVPIIGWSIGRNMDPQKPGTTYALPSGVTGIVGDTFLMTEVSYRYSPVVSMFIVENVVLENTAFGRSRARRGVTCSDCPTK